MPYEYQETPEGLKNMKRKCWCPHCKGIAIFEDWAGWHWCIYHAYYNGRWNGGSKWWWFKTLKFRNPF